MKVRIEELPSMWVASCRAVGVSPEVEACGQLSAWADDAGLLEDPETYPVFALYRAAHQASDPEHGYELWIRVDEEIEVPEGMERLEFGGGAYAVTDWSTGLGWDLEHRWEELEGWVQMSEYGFGEHQRLERLRNFGEGGGTRELYLPIALCAATGPDPNTPDVRRRSG
jgi:DNA gyrase inhibitor GyrI